MSRKPSQHTGEGAPHIEVCSILPAGEDRGGPTHADTTRCAHGRPGTRPAPGPGIGHCVAETHGAHDSA